MPEPAIHVSDLGITFGNAGRVTRVFDHVSFDAEPGRFVVLIGPSGCGKSTLLRAIGDLLPTSTGSVRVFGAEPSCARTERRISFVFQDSTLLPWRTAVENVDLPLKVGRWERLGRGAQRPHELLELVGLRGRENALPHELSGGQRQRVSIARALVTRPDILLMDEPFGALDEITRDRLNDELLRIWRETNTTIVFVTHSLSEAALLGETVLVMAANPGRLLDTIDLSVRKPGNRIDRASKDFFEITTELRRVLDLAYGATSRAL